MEGFESIQNEINWARSCQSRAEALFSAYLQDNSFAFVVEPDPHSGEVFHVFRMLKEPPVEVEHLLRNAVLDLKHSFDRSLHVAASVSGNRGFDKNYPWADSAIGLKAILRSRQQKPRTALPEGLIKEILRQKPYAGAPAFPPTQNVVREIAHMANDKHSIGFQTVAQVHSSTISKTAFIGGGVKIRNEWDPVKKELLVLSVPPTTEVRYGYRQFTVDIRFKRTGLIGQVPAFAALADFAQRAQTCLEGFKLAVSS